MNKCLKLFAILFIFSLSFTCLIQNVYAVKLVIKVVDQQGREIAGSKVNVANIGTFTTGSTADIPAGQYSVSVAPGRSGKAGDFNCLARNETVKINAAMSLLEFKWVISPVTVNIVDQNGNPGCSMITGIMNDYLSKTYTFYLPATDKMIYPTIRGICSNGYTLKSPDFLNKNEVFKVSDRPLAIKRTWNNPYFPGNGITTGRFAKIIEGRDVDKALRKQNEDSVTPSEVPRLYGKPGGFTVFDDGVDICSKEYADLRGFEKPLAPVYQDLSKGWPNPKVKSGKLAIDPASGRFALFSGNYPTKSLISSKGFAYTGFAVPGNGEVIVQGNYAYIAPGEGNFQVFDITDKRAPKPVGHFNAGFKYNPAVYKNTAYLLRKSIYPVDISRPENPKWLDGSTPWTPPSGGGAGNIVIHNGYAFVTAAGSNIGFYVLDISNPGNLKVLASLDIGDPMGGSELFIEGDRAYVAIPGRRADYSEPKGGGVVAIDISRPLCPKVLGSYRPKPGDDVYSSPYLIGCKGNIMVMTSDWRPPNFPPERPGSLMLVDMSNPARPVKRGVYTFLDDHGKIQGNLKLIDCATKDNCIYVTDCNYDYNQDSMSRNNPPTRLFTFDISNPGKPLLVDQIEQKPARYFFVSRYGNYLYVNDYNYGIRIFDVTNSRKPAYVGGTVTAGEGHWAWTNEDETRSYISQTFGGSIFCADVTNTGSPTVIGKQYWDGDCVENPIKGKNSTLYVPQLYSVSVVDFSDPSNPVKTCELPGLPEGMTVPRIDVAGNKLYAVLRDPAKAKNRLIIYDISSPNKPVFVSDTVIGSGKHAPKVCVKGEYAYIMCGDQDKLFVFEISNPKIPAFCSELF